MEASIIIHSSPAIFWDGTQQLSGLLILTENNLKFEFEDFQHSNLNLQIPIINIIIAKPFLLYKVAQIGLKIVSTNGKVDLFVLEDSTKYSKILLQTLDLSH